MNEMNEEELLKFENLYINLKNQGKSVEEIYFLLKVNIDIIKKWDLAFENELKKIPKDSPIVISIESKNSDGKYSFLQKLNFQISTLEKIKFDLWNASSISEEKLSSSNNPVLFKELSDKAKSAHQIISQYVVSIKLTEKPDGEVTVNYNLNDQSEEVLEKVNEAIGFYINTIYTIERQSRDSSFIKNKTENVYTDATKILPICLKQFYIKDFHGIKEVYIDKIPVDSNWIFITGENGFGKTLILRAITIGLFGDRDNDLVLTDELKATINLEYNFFGDSKINNIWTSRKFEKLNEMCCYGPNRLNVSSNESSNEIDRKNSSTYNLFNNNGMLLNVEYELIINYFSNKDEFERYKKLFKKLIPSISFIHVDEKDRQVYYIEKNLETNESYKQGVRFEHLASGIKSLIAMVGDMIIRLKKNQPQVQNFEDYCGIVVIDELDLHWHPKWQRQIPKILTELFPRIQFIATTHSEIPLLGAPINSIFLTVDRTVEEGIKIRKVDIDIANLLPNTVLTSPMFDMDHITSVANLNIDNVKTEDTFPEIEEDEKNRKILDEFELGEDNFPDDLFKK